MPMAKLLLSPALSDGAAKESFSLHGSNPPAAFRGQHIHSLAGCVQQLADLSAHASILFEGKQLYQRKGGRGGAFGHAKDTTENSPEMPWKGFRTGEPLLLLLCRYFCCPASLSRVSYILLVSLAALQLSVFFLHL